MFKAARNRYPIRTEALLKLLIIGDEDLFVEALGRLAPSTFSIAYAADVEEAATQVEACQPDLVIVAGVQNDQQLDTLLDCAREQYGTARKDLTQEDVTDDVLDQIAQSVSPNDATNPDNSESETLQQQIAQQAKDLKALEQRVSEVALGTTGGLSELIATMDGVQQALKLHMRMIDGLKGQGNGVLEDPSAKGLETQLANQSQDLKSLEQRISEVVVGTMGGLTELVEASDGVQQALKLHLRLIDKLEKRIDEEVIPLRATVDEMGKEIKALRRDMSAMERYASADVPADLAMEHDIDLMFEPQEDEERSESRATPIAKSPSKDTLQ